MANSFDRLHHVEPSPEARRLLWHVLSVGVVTRDEAERREAHDKPGAFLFWVSSGKGTLEAGERSFQLRPGPRCWLLDLRQPRVYTPAPTRGRSRLSANPLLPHALARPWHCLMDSKRAQLERPQHPEEPIAIGRWPGLTPSPVVNELTERNGGSVGLYFYTSGAIANLKITPKQ